MVNGVPEPDAPGGLPTTELPAVGAADPTVEERWPGWYADPWLDSQQRFWTGERWTHDTAPGPASPGPAATGEPGLVPPFPPHYAEPVPIGGAPVPPPRRSGITLIAVAAILGLLAGLGGAYVATRADDKSGRTAAGPGTNPTTPSNPTNPTTPTSPADPAAAALAGLGVGQADVPATVTVNPINNGNVVSGETTLDVCNGTYPSESLRTARLQVVAVMTQGTQLQTLLSTEAVLYTNAAATTQAFAELRRVVAACPSTPVSSPVSAPTVTTHFNPAPDTGWPQVAGVERLAYDFNTTDTAGTSTHSVAVYLRRGRALLGVYFPQPGATQSSVAGQTTMAGIVGLFAHRMAALPTSVVSG